MISTIQQPNGNTRFRISETALWKYLNRGGSTGKYTSRFLNGLEISSPRTGNSQSVSPACQKCPVQSSPRTGNSQSGNPVGLEIPSPRTGNSQSDWIFPVRLPRLPEMSSPVQSVDWEFPVRGLEIPSPRTGDLRGQKWKSSPVQSAG